MQLGTLTIALLAVTAALAGCADTNSGGTNTPVIVVPESAQEVEVTKTTGAIRGIVVDATITPIAGVAIALPGLQMNTETAEDGGFIFNDLEPGDYFLSASKFGFQTIQTAVSVFAGVENPDLVKINLPRLANQTAAYANTQQWQGFLQCGVTVVVLGFNACGLIDDRFIFYFSVDSVPDYGQAEMLWKSTQPASEELSLGYYKDGTTTNWKSIQGKTPLFLNFTRENFVKGTADGENSTENPMRVFPPYFRTSNPTATPGVGFTLNQAYDVFLTQFYGFVPREGYLFAVDGPCETYEQCGE